MKKEYDLRKMKVKKRGAVVSKSAKVMKTVRLDADVLSWLVAEAGERGIGYQTLLNSTLRDAMKGGKSAPKLLRDEIRQIVREEVKRAS
jgi:uncharacterized protein (DUF4415 family)